jgi:single-stranded-DNA-specific exonuclease
MADTTAFLGVTRSARDQTWQGPDAAADRMAAAMAQQTRLPFAVCAVLARMGVAPEHALTYLDPTLRALLPDPRSLRDMDKAGGRILSAVTKREKIAIFADYDVDGGASAALLLCWLRDLGHSATLYIPDRIDEGYGPNDAAMAALARDHDLIICVDCGTLSHGPIAAALGADVVVLDHHLGAETLPPAMAVVNPNRQDEDGTLAHLCAAGVVFLVLVEVNRRLRESGHKPLPDLMRLLDLVALATVADVAPLTGVNRAFVRQGLRVMADRGRVGLRALADSAGLDSAPRAYHLGFVLGPRVNAGGRIGAADLGARLLATDDPNEAAAMAGRLEILNTERREIEAQVRAAALAQAEARGTDGPLVWAVGEGWHPGVIGIAAARLKEATHRPAIVIALDGEIGKGSGRSVTGVDLGAAIQRLASEGLLIKGGGHKMAAGLTVHRSQIDAAMTRLAELMARQGAEALGHRGLKIDAILMPEAATPELIAHLEQAGPFGAGARAPRFAFADMLIHSARRMGDSHLRMRFGSGHGSNLEAVAFRAFETPLGELILHAQGQRLHLAGQLELNTWGGRQSVQLRLDDVASAVQ